MLCISKTTYVRMITSFPHVQPDQTLHLRRKTSGESSSIKQALPLTNPDVKFSIQRGLCALDESTLPPA